LEFGDHVFTVRLTLGEFHHLSDEELGQFSSPAL